MIVHELVSNALRHAFPDGRHGSITIQLRPGGPASRGWSWRTTAWASLHGATSGPAREAWDSSWW
jgi:two-component sensor histidine kinase